MVADKIEQEIFINAPTDKVWTIVTSPDHIKAWYAFGGAEVELRPGGKIMFRWDEHGAYHGVVETVEPHHQFSFRFSPFTADVAPQKGNSTVVTITLKPEKEGTNVRLTESGYQDLDVTEQEKTENYQTSKGAWADSLELLRSHAEKAA